ncbi:MAG: phosphoglycerate kinase [Rhizobiaceae bacterium]
MNGLAHAMDGRPDPMTVLVRVSPEAEWEPRTVARINALSQGCARVVLLAGIGEPRDDINPAYSLRKLVPAISQALGRDVQFISQSIGGGAEEAISRLEAGGIAIVENLRFHGARKANAGSFAMQLSVLGDYFVDEGQKPQDPAGWQIRLAALLPEPPAEISSGQA